MTWRVLIPLLFIIQSCQNSEVPSNENLTNSELTLRDTFEFPLDTAKIISMMNLKTNDQISEFDLYADTLDTIILKSGNFACDCQDWIMEEYDSSHNLGRHGYFIQPFNEEIELSSDFGVFDNHIRLIGTSFFDNDRHLNTKLSDTIRVFKYYAYEVLLPAKVYGPLHHTGKTELPSSSEELIQRSVITLKN